MELTAAQRSVVDHRDGRLRVTGAAATGKTTALRARYLALARDVPASRVLVVCRDRAASMAFRDEILTDLRGGFDSLPITTVFGVAHDLASRSGNERRLLGQREQWAMVEAMLADDERGAESLWPTLHRYVGRRAFADEVARAVTTLREADPGPGWAPPDDRWAELAAFAVRYQAHLDELDATDGAGLLTGAAQIAAGGGFDRFDHV
ncbi:MAG: hypothetical protein QOG03_174, partial [Actinomycetota bacterium]|nr:hypothetical protein [Actinomycetota bacterium]